MALDINTCLELYNGNQINQAYSLLDSIEFEELDSCDMLKYVMIKSDRYRIKGKVKKGYRYLKFVESKIKFCEEKDEYIFLVQKAYFASFVEKIEITINLEQTIDRTPNTISDTSTFGIKRLHLKAKIAKHLGRKEECRQLINKAINIQLYRGNLDHPESSGFLRTMAHSYLEEGQFERAREYFRVERKIYSKHRDLFPKMLGIMFYNEANTHYEQLELQEAITDYDSTLFYWSIDPPSKVYMRYVNEALGDLYYELENLELASKYWAFASEIKSPKSNDKADKLPDVHSLSKESNFISISEAYNDALDFRKSTYGDNHFLTGECLTFVGRLNEIQNENQKALTTYNQALGILIPGFDFFENSMDKDSLDLIDRYGFDALLGMTRIYFSLYSKTNDQVYLDSAYMISEFAFQALDKVKISFEDSHTALFWLDFTYPLTELSLKIHYTFHQIYPSKGYVEKAFLNAEASRAYLLRSTLHKDNVLRKGTLPNDLKTIEQELKGKLHRLKGSIKMEEKRCSDAQQVKIRIWQDELVMVQHQYAFFLAKMSETHPTYFKKMYDTPSLNYEQLLIDLKERQTGLLSFFYGEESIFRFHSKGESIGFEKIEIDQDFKLLYESFLIQISNYQDDIDLHSNLSKLYQLLIGDIDFSQNSSLVIIPDGPLYYLPWEVLSITNDSLDRSTYLIEKYAISYSQSATLLHDYYQSAPKNCEILLSIYPEYEVPLSFNSNDLMLEVDDIKVKVLTGEDVTKEQIINDASKANIIHFAGHSVINEDNEMMSELDLGIYEDKPLRSFEIFDMDLDASLVVLSACHSGSGKYKRGEGIMNLSQAFQQAGSESVIMSLWSVDDQSTSELFSIFYKELVKGSRKSVALREAKLYMIKSGDPVLSHPYFWASFVLFGDDDPIISKRQGSIFLYSGLGIIIFSILGLILYRKRKLSIQEVA